MAEAPGLAVAVDRDVEGAEEAAWRSLIERSATTHIASSGRPTKKRYSCCGWLLKTAKRADQHAVEPRQVTAAARRCRMAARMSSREDGARLVNGLSYVLSGLATEVAVHRCVVAVAQTTPGSGAL